jgi:hypothetical protein
MNYVATADIYVAGQGEVASILTGHFCVLRGITTCCKFHHRTTTATLYYPLGQE